jgi:biopolymer transport protein ExbD
MSFVFVCPHCETRHRAADAAEGRRIRCPACQQVVEVTRADGDEQLAAAATGEAEPTWGVRTVTQSSPSYSGSGSRREARPGLPSPRSAPPPGLPPEPPVQFGAERKKSSEAEMDMTPMVDVTFLLLIFFMVTAAFSLQKSLETPKPDPSDQPSTEVVESIDDNPDYITILVDENNTFYVSTVDWERECPTQQELLVRLREARRGDAAGRQPTKLLVRAHGDSSHERVVMALDAGSSVGIEETQLMTIEDDF